MGEFATSYREFAQIDGERPIAEVGPVQTIYVNGISGLELIGSDGGTLRFTFYVDGRSRMDGQPVEKVPEIALIMSVADYMQARREVAARLKALGLNVSSGEPN